MRNSILSFLISAVLLAALVFPVNAAAKPHREKKNAAVKHVAIQPEETKPVPSSFSSSPAETGGYVHIIDMKMMILPGTASFLKEQINLAAERKAKVLVVRFDTPGGLLDTSQEMIQEIFKSPVPIVFYVTPAGGTATSAGVFIVTAAHVAAMAPGTSIGSAHPVMGDGKNIEGDMRTKAENMTVALVKAIAERRGRNVGWVEKAVKQSESVTEKEALKLGVIDIVADNLDDLLRQTAGREVRLENATVTLGDYSALPREVFEISAKDRFFNVLANPNVAALLWLAATTGISIELYNPGAILPGVVGIICLVLALIVSQIIPISQGAVVLIAVGALLIGLELYTGSLALGIGGVIAMVIGAIYLVDVTQAPGMSVALEFVIPVAALFGGFMLLVAVKAASVLRRKATTGNEGMVGKRGTVVEKIGESGGRVFINGEYWNAALASDVDRGTELSPGETVEVKAFSNGLTLRVARIKE